MLPNARGRGSDLLWRCCNTYRPTSIPVLWMSSYSSLYGGMSHIWKYLLPKIWDFLYSLTVVYCGSYSTLVSLNATVSRCIGWRRPLFKMVTNLPVHICSQREYSQTITDNVIIWIQLPAVLWHPPVKIEWRGFAVAICPERGADSLHMVQLTPLFPKTSSSLTSFKSRLVLPF